MSYYQLQMFQSFLERLRVFYVLPVAVDSMINVADRHFSEPLDGVRKHYEGICSQKKKNFFPLDLLARNLDNGIKPVKDLIGFLHDFPSCSRLYPYAIVTPSSDEPLFR